MRFAIPRLFKDPWVRNPALIAFSIQFIAWMLSFAHLRGVSHLLILDFSGPRGAEVIGTSSDVFVFLMSALFSMLINLFLVHVFYERMRLVAYLLACFNMLFSVLILIAIGAIMAVN